MIWSDDGKEFLMDNYFKDKGIIHQRTCIETPQQNDVAKRKHRHILNVSRAIMFQSNLTKLFWNFGISHAVYLINRQSSPITNSQPPYELLRHSPPDYTNLKAFGCLVFALTIVQWRQKFNPRATKCMFLGFKHDIKWYISMNLNTRERYLFRWMYMKALFLTSYLPQ